jgi:hypothetical protein
MRVQVDPQAAPRTLYWGERRTTIVEVIDQWHGPGYRYVKVKGYDSNVYILRFDQIRDTWDLIMFSSERAPRLSTGAARPGSSSLAKRGEKIPPNSCV